MKPIDLRNANFEEMKASLPAKRLAVWRAWCREEVATTREISENSGIDLLTVRPRTTELYQMGLLALWDAIDGEGVYRLRDQEEWESWRRLQLQMQKSKQLQLV